VVVTGEGRDQGKRRQGNGFLASLSVHASSGVVVSVVGACPVLQILFDYVLE
jgi:hypothetical protein